MDCEPYRLFLLVGDVERLFEGGDDIQSLKAGFRDFRYLS